MIITLTSESLTQCRAYVEERQEALAESIVLNASSDDDLYEFSLPTGWRIFLPPQKGKTSLKDTILVFFPIATGSEVCQLTVWRSGRVIPKGMASYTHKEYAPAISSIQRVHNRFS